MKSNLDEFAAVWSCSTQALEGALRGIPFGLVWGSSLGVIRILRSRRTENSTNGVISSDSSLFSSKRTLGLRKLWQFRAPRPFVYPSHHYVSIISACAFGRAIEFGVFTAQYYGIYCLLDRAGAACSEQSPNPVQGNVHEGIAGGQWLQNPRLIAAAAGTASGVSTVWLKWLLVALRDRLVRQWVPDLKPPRFGKISHFLGTSTVVGAFSAAVCYAVEAFRE